MPANTTVALMLAGLAGIAAMVVVRFGRRAMSAYRMFNAAQTWATVSGHIIESRVAESIDHQGRTTHDVVIRYEFVIGQRFEGNTPRASGDVYLSLAEQLAIVRRFQTGTRVDVFYDPADPRRSCLDRTDASGIKWTLVLTTGLLTLCAILAAVLVHKR